MKEYNEHNASEKLTKMLDGELDPSLEADLQSEIDTNPDLEMEMKDHLAIRRAIREDKEKLVPSLSTTKSVFAAAGITALTSGVASSPSLVSTLFGTAGKIITASLLTASVAVVGFFSMEDNDTNDIQATKETKIVEKIEDQQVESEELENAINTENNSQIQVIDQEIVKETQTLSSNSNIKTTVIIDQNENLHQLNEPQVLAEVQNSNSESLINADERLIIAFDKSIIYQPEFTSDSYESNGFGFSLKNNKYKEPFFKQSLFNLNLNAVNNPFFGTGYSGSLELNVSRVSKSMSRVISQASFEFGQFRGDQAQNLIALNFRISPDMRLISWSNGGNIRPILELKAGQLESFMVGGAIGLEMNTFLKNSYLQVRFNNLNTNYLSVGLRKSF